MVVLSPSNRRENGHGGADNHETPIVQGAEIRVPAWTFPGEHGRETRQHAPQASQDVYADQGQKSWRVEWDRDPSHRDRSLIHQGACTTA